MDLDQPVATTEFLVVDTETNGLAGDACELTEVGAVLVGGGELHERWETLLDRAGAALARHPALHRDHAGDGRRGAAGRGAAARARRPAARARAGGPQRVVRPPRPAPGVRARRVALAAPAPAVHGGAGAAAAPARAPAPAAGPGRVAGDRGRGLPSRAGRRRDLRARVLRAVPAAVRPCDDGARGARARAPRPPAPRAGEGHRRAARARAARAGGCPTSPT